MKRFSPATPLTMRRYSKGFERLCLNASSLRRIHQRGRSVPNTCMLPPWCRNQPPCLLGQKSQFAPGMVGSLRGVHSLRYEGRRIRDAVHGKELLGLYEKLKGLGDGTVQLEAKSRELAEITVANPQKKNALSGKMMVELADAVDALASDPAFEETRVIYVRGSHGFFCSGADLSVLKNHFGEKDGVDMCYFMQATLDKLRQLDIISVALVEGMAIGGGTEVALSCDFRVFEAGAGFRMVQAHRGLSPGWGAGAKLLKLVGRRRAIELLCGARELRGDELLEYGVADCIADAGPIEDAADRFCAAFLHEGYTDAVKQCKRLIAVADELPSEEILMEEANIFERLWSGPSFKETLAKFKPRK